MTATTKKNAYTARAALKPLLTVKDLERLLRVDRRTVARLCKKGEFPRPMKLGGGNRWRAEEVAQLIERQAPSLLRSHHTPNAEADSPVNNVTSVESRNAGLACARSPCRFFIP
jgi:predicted DNA-binding transcriptional regulator AlpA